MEQIDDFKDIGKQLPWQEPYGFFDQLPEKTLLKARNRNHKHARKIFLWRTFSAAASLVAIVFVGQYFWDSGKPEKVVLVVQDEQKQTEQVTPEKTESLEAKPILIRNVDSVSILKSASIDMENMNDILVDLSDAELTQLAAMYQTDPFTEEMIP